MIAPTLLGDAAQALEALGQGQTPEQPQALAGIVALDALLLDPLAAGDCDLMEAAQGLLLTAATSGAVYLDEVGRARVRILARKVRELARI